MVIKGIDVGYQYTKDNNHRIFKSAYSLVDNSLSNSKQIIIDGVTYYVGSGIETTDADKTQSTINMVCTLYNMASASTVDSDYIISVGLPVGQYKAQREELKEAIYEYNSKVVHYKGHRFNYRIRNVTVSPQGVAAVYNIIELQGRYIIVDIGGGTIDTCLLEFTKFDSRISKHETYYKGIKTLYNAIITEVNNKYKLKLDMEYAETILNTGTLIVDGEREDLSFLKHIVQNYIDGIVEYLNINYPIRTTPIYLCGGGSILTFDALKRRLPHVLLMENSQFANANGYYKIAKARC